MIFFSESLQNKRSRNEDSLCHMDLQMNHEATVSAFVVADGMGGLSEGHQYSRKALDLWYEELLKLMMGEDFRGCALKAQIEVLEEFCAEVFHGINRKLYKAGMDLGIKGGTTLSAAVFFWDSWIISNCGDSPVYVLKGEKLELASDIQNLAWKYVKEGRTKVGSSLFLQNKNRLTEFLGRRQEIHPHCMVLDGREVDGILLGSDGAFGNLTPEQMEEILRSEEPARALPRLLEAAREGGEKDNQTAFLILPHRKQSEDQPFTDEKELKLADCEEQDEEDFSGTRYRRMEEESIGKRLLNLLTGRGDRR